jgi:hypothetical protein
MKFVTETGETFNLKFNEPPIFVGYTDNDPEGKVMGLFESHG